MVDEAGDATPMGDNLDNPQAASASQVAPPGVQAPTAPQGGNPGGETAAELAKDKIYAEADAALLRQRLALAEDDRRKANGAAEDKRKEIASWQDAFGLHDGVDPKDAVRETIGELDAAKKRVAALHQALGIGGDADPVAAVAAFKATQKLEGGTLPARGMLLLLTQLAKHDPYLGAAYRPTPDVLSEGNGDRWTATRVGSLQDDGTMGHVVEIHHTPGTFAHQQAMSDKQRYDGELAVALRGQRDARKAQGVGVTGLTKAQVDERAAMYDRRVAEIQDAIKSLEPRLVPPATRTWQFSVDLDSLIL